MKRFSLIEEDRYINIDNIGIFFAEDNWPSSDIENLWAIQWKDDGTPEGRGEIEFTSTIPNKPCTVADLKKYIDHYNIEYQRQLKIKKEKEEEDLKRATSWQQVMQEIESRMEEMQQRHEKTLAEVQEEASKEIERIQHKVAQDHELLFYSVDEINDGLVENERVFEIEPAVDVSLFEGDVDPSLYEESIDKEYFETNETHFDSDSDEIDIEDDIDQIIDFDNLDLSVLESEFSLEMLFDEDSSEQIVPEIEELISETNSDTDQITE